MSQYSWATCPAAARSQIERLLATTQDALQDNLTGVYLHGSLAMGCFNPERSDLDLLVITRAPMSVETKRALVEALLRLSGNPAPIEISFLSAADLTPWRYPTPFDLHYSEDGRSRCEQALARERPTGARMPRPSRGKRQPPKALATDTWRAWNDQRQEDIDLAAHITVTRARGICLLGQPIDETFPPVPARDYIAAIWDDFLVARAHALNKPFYFVLNACRVAAYLLEERICSKEEGGVWALNRVPQVFRGCILQALNVYRSEQDTPFHAAELEQFGAFMEDWLRPFVLAAS
jgi:predicted nucleotidyltransferase